MVDFYTRLGINIVLDAIVRASDVNDVEKAIIRELNRRRMTTNSVTAVADTPITAAILDSIHKNCKTGGYTGADPVKGLLSASQMQTYISFIKELYRKKIVS